MRSFVLLLALVSGSAAAEVPISIADSGHAVVPVEGSFGVRQFVFDTGAEGTAVYANLAAEAGLQQVGSEVLQGQTGAADAALFRIDRLTLDGVTKGPITATGLSPRADGVPLAGIVGLDVFGDRVVDFDLPRKRLALLAPGQRPIPGRGLVATVTAGNLLTIPVRIGSVDAVAVIDTGARKTRINWNLARRIGIDAAMLAKGDRIDGATNKAIETGATTLRSACLGKYMLTDAPVLVADLPVFEVFGVADKPALILGLDWLAGLRMAIDFPARQVWFERRAISGQGPIPAGRAVRAKACSIAKAGQ